MRNTLHVGIIGAGNMATSLVGGLIADKFHPDKIWVSNTGKEKLENLQKRFQVNVTTDNSEVLQHASVIVFAVKPQSLRKMCAEIQEKIQEKKPLIISIAAGIREKDLQRWLGGGLAIVRCMPNTAALIRSAMTGMYANDCVTALQKEEAEFILRAVGLTTWFENERLMDAVTALSGSGPAYFFLVMEALEQAGEVLGFTRKEARLLTLQTAIGAARMALESGEPLDVLREKVTSAGGVTERAIRALESGGLRQLFVHALQEADWRAEEIATLLGKQY